MIFVTTHLEQKHFYRKIEQIFSELQGGMSSRLMIEKLISRFYLEFEEPLNLKSAQVYEKSFEKVSLLSAFGNSHNLGSEILYLLGTSHANHEISDLPYINLLHDRLIAILPAAEDRRILIAFVGEDSNPGDDFKSYWSTAFSSFYYLMVQHLRRIELQDVLEQARAIQMSLLPDPNPEFFDFDIAATSIPAELVGGDVFDFVRTEPSALAISLADAAGHGLPAALQARDVMIGLRMGLERYGSVSLLVEKLNRVFTEADWHPDSFLSFLVNYDGMEILNMSTPDIHVQ